MGTYWTSGSGRRVGVAGLGRSGRAAARLLSGKGFVVTGFDDDPSVEECEFCASHRLGGGDGPLSAVTSLEGLILSPGVPPSSPLPCAARAAGVPVIGEIELAWRNARAPVLAVTGSNGKTTTAEWLGHVLRTSGMKAVVAGNVGYPFSSAVLDHPDPDWFVLEVSSYQLETIEHFRPAGAAVLNLTPDHLQRHGSMEGYRAAKARIFSNQQYEDLAVINMDDPESVPLMGVSRGVERYFSIERQVPSGADAAGGAVSLVFDGARTEVMKVRDLSLPGAHNLANALAVACLASRAGVHPEALARGLSSFGGVPHRIEKVRTLNGVDWVNDSKSTNQDSLRVALLSFDRPVLLIAGGLSKKTAYRELRDLVSARVKQIVLIGSASAELEEAWRGAAPCLEAGTMEEAVRICREMAVEGDVVLLSPACASFDQYRDFEERGRHFRALVEAMEP